jgi:hypothetical protein
MATPTIRATARIGRDNLITMYRASVPRLITPSIFMSSMSNLQAISIHAPALTSAYKVLSIRQDFGC